MDRKLLNKIILLIRKNLEGGKDIGNLKVSAFYTLGQQLSALLYYVGHEIGSILKVNQMQDKDSIVSEFIKTVKKYNIGDINILEITKETISLELRNHSSIRDLINENIDSDHSFCSFEAGVLAGIIEKIGGNHCFSQEVKCGLQSKSNYCEFIIIFQQN